MKRNTIFTACLLAASTALASPGAHGPNGEHLDGPAGQASTGAVPRIEAVTEDFELVGTLSGGELSILIDRYESNEPVLNGKLDVQYQALKASATFHADIGDYAITDQRFLQAISTPGKHALLFTLVAGKDSDLLEGTLEVAATAAHAPAPARFPRWVWIGAPVMLLSLAVGLLRRRQLKIGK
ncbi:hypothetical protein ACFDR9_000048 [Janthinobacterium sp. CG_23.3]|uniref:hypothetical protein n=1 Tax=Janthinobacterium sp. CG_23.3 TaxID=3349634 RepID=UPI0038D4E02C